MKRCALLVALMATPALAQSPVTPPDFQMPGGGGCGGLIARYRAVQQNDYASGNVAKSVHAQIAHEIDAAEAACSAGQDAKASAMIHASEARHGYSTRL